MICEVLDATNFFWTWAFLTVAGLVAIAAASGVSFYALYVNPTFEMWRWKTNPRYPSPAKVRDEALMSFKGVCIATLAPALSLYMAKHGLSQAYCGIDEQHPLGETVVQFLGLLLVTDFYEWGYHNLGHRFTALWQQHRSHHTFANPTPFSVVADDVFDQVVRSAPMLLFTLVMPVNVDVLFVTWAVLFYAYGVFLHCGYESPFYALGAHQPVLNVSYHHHLHHALATNQRAFHTGFFFQVWDRMTDSTYKGECFCCECQHKQGKRTEEEFKQVVIPDYSVLTSPAFWISGATSSAAAAKTL